MIEPEKLGDIIARSRVGNPKKRKLRLELIRLNWVPIAGERIAGHSLPTRLSKGTLTATADSAAWASELSAKSAEILRGVERLLGKAAVKKIRVQAAKSWTPLDAGEQSRAEGQIGGSEPVEPEGKIAEELNRLEDDDVREALARLYRSGKASKQYNQADR